jgi:NADH-quinone oxidoreductase subunit G
VSELTVRRDLVLPAHESLFTSGVLGEHTAALTELNQYQTSLVIETAAPTAAD